MTHTATPSSTARTAAESPRSDLDIITAGRRALLEEVMHHNTGYEGLEHARAHAALIGVVIHTQDRLTLWQGERHEQLRHEQFTLHVHDGRPVLTGRGGSFDLNDRVTVTQALSTVLPTAPHGGQHLNLRARLAERGFTLLAGRSHTWKYDVRLTPLTAVHDDGTVLWFRHLAANCCDSSSVSHGLVHLASYTLHLDEETRTLMGLEDAELDRDDLRHFVPDRITPHHWGVSGDALDAIIRHARTARGTVLTPEQVPYRLPDDYQQRAETGAFDTPEWTYTREQALAASRTARARHAERYARPDTQSDPDAEHVPF